MALFIWEKARASVGNLLGKQRSGGVEYTAKELKIFAASSQIGWTIFLFAVGGDIAIAMWAKGAPAGTSFMALLGADILVAAAAAAAGSLFGFVFGIPRTVDPAAQAAAMVNQGGNSTPPSGALATNTNLERISDWLTTLLIGATLVQIKDIVSWIGGLGKSLAATGTIANDAIVPIIVIYFFALSFLGVYLITRLYLTSALGFGDRLALAISAKPLREKLSDAAGSNKVEDLKPALADVDVWQSTGQDRDDPELSANAARIIVKLMANSEAKGRETDLARFLNNAVKNPDQKVKLQAELAAGRLTTKAGEVDAAIKQVLQ
jgi:hypothetical protein